MSTIIQVKCTDQVLTYENTPIIASGGVQEDYIKFTFCEKWDGLTKTAVFWRSEKEVYHVLLDETDGCAVPPEVLAAPGVMYFGVFGVTSEGKQRTSEVLRYNIETGAINPGTKPLDPTPDIYMQIMAEFLRFEDEIRAGQDDFRTEWEEYQQQLNQEWENYKTGGFYVLKETYEADLEEIDKALAGKVGSVDAGLVKNENGNLSPFVGLWRILVDHETIGSIRTNGLSPDGKKFVFVTNTAPTTLCLLNPENNSLSPIATAESPANIQYIYVLNDFVLAYSGDNLNMYIYRLSDDTLEYVAVRGGIGWTSVQQYRGIQIPKDDPNVFLFIGRTSSSPCRDTLYKFDKQTLEIVAVKEIAHVNYNNGVSYTGWYPYGDRLYVATNCRSTTTYGYVYLRCFDVSGEFSALDDDIYYNSSSGASGNYTIGGLDPVKKLLYVCKVVNTTCYWNKINLEDHSIISSITISTGVGISSFLDGEFYTAAYKAVDPDDGVAIDKSLDAIYIVSGPTFETNPTGLSFSSLNKAAKKPLGKLYFILSGNAIITDLFAGKTIDIGGVVL